MFTNSRTSTSHANGWEVKFQDALGVIFGCERQILMLYLMHEHVCRHFQTHFHFDWETVCATQQTAKICFILGFLNATKIKIVFWDEVVEKIFLMTVRYFEKKCSSLVVKDKYWWFIWCMHGHPSTADEAWYWPKHVLCSGWIYITPHYSQLFLLNADYMCVASTIVTNACNMLMSAVHWSRCSC